MMAIPDNGCMILPVSQLELRSAALQALCDPDIKQKASMAQMLRAQADTIYIATEVRLAASSVLPGCPARPELRAHLQLARRSPFTPEGLAGLLHAVAHIEFNAINLALDAIWRFPGMPRAYYLDWLTVAAEEAHHFSLLQAHLQTLGFDYGDFPAHTGLWDMTARTEGDVLARMALVPRTLEARGLDATPPMQAKLRQVGTPAAMRAVEILSVILQDEIGHVAIGNYWYRYLCTKRGLDPLATYASLATQYRAPRLRGPLNLDARRAAGFDDAELDLIQAQS
jgi:uncharacterized ferritin-like protein (DUF455 family)